MGVLMYVRGDERPNLKPILIPTSIYMKITLDTHTALGEREHEMVGYDVQSLETVIITSLQEMLLSSTTVSFLKTVMGYPAPENHHQP